MHSAQRDGTVLNPVLWRILLHHREGVFEHDYELAFNANANCILAEIRLAFSVI